MHREMELCGPARARLQTWPWGPRLMWTPVSCCHLSPAPATPHTPLLTRAPSPGTGTAGVPGGVGVRLGTTGDSTQGDTCVCGVWTCPPCSRCRGEGTCGDSASAPQAGLRGQHTRHGARVVPLGGPIPWGCVPAGVAAGCLHTPVPVPVPGHLSWGCSCPSRATAAPGSPPGRPPAGLGHSPAWGG